MAFHSILLITLIFLSSYVCALKPSNGASDSFSFDHKISSHITHSEESLTADEEYRLFLEEIENGTFAASEELHHRSKRYVIYNTDTNMAVALIMGLPFTIVLPTLTNVFGNFAFGNLNFFGRKRRSAESNNMVDGDYDILDDQFFKDVPEVQPTLNKLTAYFELVQITKRSCQLRTICELSSEPDEFIPFSNLVLNRLRDPDIPPEVFEKDEGHSLFKLYNTAADYGQAYGLKGCEKKYGEMCEIPIHNLLNMPVLRFWRALSSVLGLKFHDNV